MPTTQPTTLPIAYDGADAATPDGTVRHAIAASALGLVLVAATAAGVRFVLLGDDADALRAELRARLPLATLAEGDERLQALASRVAACVDGAGDAGAVPLDARGTEFQRRVWDALREIPPGATTTYAELARRVGRPAAVRAVAGACAANPMAVLVPCHRVVRADGGLSGYRWGVERKRRLLEREGAR
jgi:AraC family transcriptional regulator of adaptative response/methylated-DNA-[protein]-cysteine methyltransferase